MLRWYGRLRQEEAWAKSPRSTLAKLVKNQLAGFLGPSTGITWFQLPSRALRMEGEDGYLELAPMQISVSDIEWLGSKPRTDSTSLQLNASTTTVVHLTAFRGDGRAIAGASFSTGSLFASEEIEHALWTHFGDGKTRQKPRILACSSERPPPTLVFRSPLTYHRGLSLFQCDNPGCTGYRRPVLVDSRSDYRGGNGAGAIAFACPRCSGGWYDRWALTWLRFAVPSDLTREQFVQYPVSLTEQRRNVLSGSMALVVEVTRSQEPWGWHPRNIRRLPRSFRKFLRSSMQCDLVAAMREGPDTVGDILPGVLQRGNLRALVEYVRALPVSKRLRGLPRCLGHAFCSQRPTAYRVSQESTQISHHFYIAYSPDLFMALMDYYGVADCGGNFLDVGSGIGEKPFIAYSCCGFDRCDGLEYDARTHAVADFLLNQIQTEYRYPIHYELGDALQFSRYGDYDVIYMYRPMRDKTMMSQLFLKIGTDMKIGATCMDVMEKDLAFRRIAENEYAMVSEVDSKKKAIWGRTMSLQDFLESVNFVPPEKS